MILNTKKLNNFVGFVDGGVASTCFELKVSFYRSERISLF